MSNHAEKAQAIGMRGLLRKTMGGLVAAATLIVGLALPGAIPQANAANSPIAANAYKPEVRETTRTFTINDPADGNRRKQVTIKHPGIFLDKEYLDAMRDGVRAGQEPWVSAYNAYGSTEFAKPNVGIFYEDRF